MLFNISTKVVARHFDIRISQVKLHSETSSIYKAFRSQGPPIVTSVLSRLDRAASTSSSSQGYQDSTPTAGKAGHRSVQSEAREEPGQDNHFEQSNQSFTGHQIPDPTVDAERGHQSSTTLAIPNPVPPERGPFPDDARKLQPQAESQTPSRGAGPAGAASPAPAASGDDVDQGLAVDQEKDIYYQPPGRTSPVLSALPRVRVPKLENDVQGGDPHIPKGINADVYYSGSDKKDAATAPDEPSEEQLSRLFHNRRIAGALGGKPTQVPRAFGARTLHTTSGLFQKPTNAETESIQNWASSDLSKNVQQPDVRNLSADICELQD